MQEKLTNTKVIIDSPEEMIDGRFYTGSGMVQRTGKRFHFVVEEPRREVRNPRVFDGGVLKVKLNKCGVFRMTGMIPGDMLLPRNRRRLLRTLNEDIKQAIKEMTVYGE